MPALAKTWSMRPWICLAFLKRAVRSAQLAVLVSTCVKLGESWFSTGGWRSPLTTDAPSESSSLTVARPIPEEPPVVIEQSGQLDALCPHFYWRLPKA